MDEPILGIEGALGPFSAAALSGGRSTAAAIDGKSALEKGLVLVERVLAEGGLSLSQLKGLAVGTGPGGFTGLRIAISFAKSLAQGLDLPLAGVSSFDLLDDAAGALERFPRLTVVAGRPGVVCIRRSDRDGSVVACGPIAPAVARLLPQKVGEVAIVGATEDVTRAVGERATSVLLATPAAEIAAVTLTRIARTRAPSESAHALAPDYGELPAAMARERK